MSEIAFETVEELMEAIAAATRAALEALEEQVPALSGAYEDVLRSGGRRTARSLRAKAQALTADATFVPPDEDEVVDSAATRSDIEDVASQAQADAAGAVGDAFAEEGLSFEVDQIFTQDMLDAIGERAAFAADEELRAQYRSVIEQAAEEGWSVNRTAETLVDAVDAVAPSRAEALARTDLNGLANGASVHLATVSKDPDATVYKTWLATNDDRTRETHVEADGQSVLVNETFDVGLSRLSYPGDPFGPPEEVMNCRCTVVYGTRAGSAVVSASALPLPALARALPTTELAGLAASAEPQAQLAVEVAPQHDAAQLALVSMLAARATDLSALGAALEALAAAVARPQLAPVVHVHVPEAQQLAAEAPTVQVDVHVPEQEAPVVNVEVPVQPLDLAVTVEREAPKRIEFERDSHGLITAAEEVE